MTVTNSAGSANSSTGVLTVAAAPVIIFQPVSQTIGAGSNAVFNVVATGAEPLSYQWKKDTTNLTDNANVSGSDTSSLTISGASQDYAGLYSVFISNGEGNTNSDPATLTVIDPPVITIHPVASAVMPTSNTTFSVTATGTSLVYQWKRNGSDLSDGGVISGASTALLSLSGVSFANAGDYSVLITNLAGSATSSNAALTLGPEITVQPANGIATVGSNATFTVVATGSPTLTYQWRTNGIDLADGGNIAGATSATLTLINAQHTDEGINFSVVVSNEIGSVTSTDATLTAYDAPVITLQPISQTPAPLSDVSLVVAVTGSSPLSYQWRRNAVALTNGPNISGATTATLSLSAVTASDTGSYTVVVTNAGGTVTSSNANITVTYSLPYSDSFNYTADANLEGQTNPATLVWNTAGSSGTGHITVTNGNLDVPGLVSSTGNSIRIIGGVGGPSARFSFPAGNSITTGTVYYSFLYKAEDLTGLSAAGGSSGGFNNSTGPQGTAPTVIATRFNHRAAVSGGTNGYNIGMGKGVTITWDPGFYTSNETVLIVGSYTFNTNSATDDVSEMWINPDPSTFGDVSAPAPNITSTTDADIGSLQIISFIFRLPGGTAQPARAVADELRIGRTWADVVVSAAPLIVTGPADQTNAVGTTANFTVSATGEALEYQWKKGASELTGETTSALAIVGVTTNDAGSYSVVVSNAFGTVESDPATLTVLEGPAIGVQPSNIAFLHEGQSAVFNVTASGGELTYQWRTNGTAIAGATGSSLTWLNTQPADTGLTFSVEVTNAVNSVISSNAAIVFVKTDDLAPKVTVITPKKAGGTNATFITVTGKAVDSGALNSGIISWVRFGYNAGNALTGPVTNETVLTDLTKGSWSFASAPIALVPGTNIIAVSASDVAGNVTNYPAFIFYYDSYDTVDIVINHATAHVKSGTLVAANNGTTPFTNLKVGRQYKFDAYVDTGTTAAVFTNWATSPIDDPSSTNKWVQKSSRTFMIQSNMVINANFMTNPFTDVAGTYNGLFSETNGATHETAGFIQVKVKDKSSYSGYLLFDGVKRSFSGKFLTDGTVSATVTRTKVMVQPDVAMNLVVDLTGGEQVTGTVSATNGAWTAEIQADKMVYGDKAVPVLMETNYAGNYTLQLPSGLGAPGSSPGGVSFGVVSNSSFGFAKLGGILSESAKLSQKVSISRDGNWPLYVGLYKNTAKVYKGSIQGWVTFVPGDFGPSSNNVVNWIKKDGSDMTAIYPGGFSNSVELAGSPYEAPPIGTTPIDLFVGSKVIVSEGNLAAPVTNLVTAIAPTASGTKVTLSAVTTEGVTNKASIVFKGKDGTFTGGFLNPVVKTKTQGVVLQNVTNASGWFTNTSQSGTIRIE